MLSLHWLRDVTEADLNIYRSFCKRLNGQIIIYQTFFFAK